MISMKKVKISLLLLLSIFCFNTVFTEAVIAEIVLVANKSVSNKQLNKIDIKKIFIGKIVTWSDGQPIKVVTLKKSDTSGIHKEFVKSYIRKTPSQFRSYWKKQVFTGKASSPKSLKSQQDLISYVSETDGAIGYISSNIKPEGVKIIKITD